MAMNPYALLKELNVIRVNPDHQIQQETVTEVNRIIRIGVITREAMRELTDLVMYSEGQMLEGLMAKQALESRLEAIGALTDDIQTLNQLRTHFYLRQMAKLTEAGAEAISHYQARLSK